MKQSTHFAQVATNLLNVLQGYAKVTRLMLMLLLTLCVSVELWGTENANYKVTAASATYTVAYNANGGEGIITDNQGYTNGATVTVKGNYGALTRVGYAFTGWNTKADGTGTDYKHGDQFTIVANTTLYAQWCKAYWKLLTDASELEDDTRIIIAAKDYNYALSTTQNTNNRGQSKITKKYNTITFGDGVQVLRLIGLTNNEFALYTGSGYLIAASSSNNYLKTGTAQNGNGNWSIAISQGAALILAQGDKTNNQIKYNSTSSLFSCYGENNSQKDVVIYKEVCVQDQYNVNEPKLTHAIAANTNLTAVASTDRTLTLQYAASEGYLLPEDIIVKMGGALLTSGIDYTWNKADGILTVMVTGFYGDIDVKMVAEEDPCCGFAMSEVTATSTTNSIILTWTAVEGATGYNVRLGDGAFTAVTGTSYTFEELYPKRTYNWEVQAVKESLCQTSKTGSTTTQKETFTVSWVVNGNTIKTESVVDDESITEYPSDPEDDDLGYCATKFMGWSEMDLGSTEGQSAPDDLCSAAEMKAKYTSLTEDKTFYAVFATQGKDEATVSVAIADYADDNNWSDKTKYSSVKIDEIITVDAVGGGNTGKYYINGENWRLYQSEDAELTISAQNDCLIESVIIEYSAEDSGILTYNGSKITSGASVEVNSTSVTFVVSNNNDKENGKVFITKMEVTYAYPKPLDYVTKCAELPTPTYAGPTIDKNELKVKCGDRSSMNSAATIAFDPTTNYDLSLPITLTASEGFLLSTNKTKNDAYTTSVTVYPVKSNENGNQGKITQKVYVRADATADTKADYTGTITIEGAQVEETKTIDVTAIVTCTPHTLTFYSHDAKTKEKYYVGEDVQEPETPASPCEGYVFDGWSESIVEEGAITYSKVTFPYEMPNRNTILYAVYRISGGTYAKVTEALEDYSGEYLIVYENGNVAFDGGLSTLDAASNTISVEITDNAIASTTTTDAAKFTIAKVDGGYSIQSASGYYIGWSTKDENGLNSNTKYNVNYYLNKIYNGVVSGVYGELKYNNTSGQNRFRYYKSGQQPIALYKKDNRYTSYPDCTPPVEPEKPQALPATFSVSTTEKVQFSAGNLQYHHKDKVWRFAPEQYDVIGEQNIELGNPNFKDWVDMFGWSADGKFGVNSSNNQDDYNKEFVDWGKVFSEEKYGVSGDEWYTLSKDEWYYLLYTRTNASSLKQVAIVGEMIGVLLFPDNWVMPAGVTTSQQTDADGVEYYPYTLDQWKQLEAAGAVFLPAAGRRTGGWGNTTVSPHIEDKENPDNFDSEGYYRWQDNTNYYGYYWTSTKDSDDKTYFLITCKMSDDGETGNPSLPSLWKEDGRYGQSVRLVRKCAQLQVVEWKENSIVIMYNGDPAQTATVTINNEQKGTVTLSDSEVAKDIAVYELPATGLASSPNQPLEIAIGNAKALMTIPYIAIGNATNAPANSDLVILKGATYTANGEQLRNVTVYGGGKLVVGNGASLSTSTLTLRIGGVKDGNYDYVYPEFVLNGTWTNKANVINLDYLTTKEQYYTFVAPFAVQTKDIQYPVEFYGNNVAAGNRGSFEFQYYDGEARATGATGWKTVEEDPTNGDTLTQGIGYTFLGMPKMVKVNGGTSTRQKFGIHRIPMNVTSAEAMAHEANEQSVPLSVHLAEKNNDSGWNLIGNPYMTTITGLTNDDIQVGKLVQANGTWHWDEQTVQENQRFLVIPSNDGQAFESVQASNATLPAFKNFFVQIGNKDANALTIPNTRVDQSLAPARRVAEEVEGDIELAVVLEQEGVRADQMDFLINNAYSAAFDYNADFTKMMNATKLNLYGVHTDDNLSFVALDNHAAQQAVVIGYQVPAAGEYTLRMSDKAYVMWERIEALYVTDHEAKPEVTTDIMMNPYVFHVANAETNNTRFTISIRLRENSGITTDLENRYLDTQQPYKFCYQDKLYIICNGVIYDATGKQVRVMNK